MSFLTAIWVALALCGGLRGQTDYAIDLADAQSGWLTVTAETSCPQAECDFQMPVWSATYQVRDFAQYVKQWGASSRNGQPLPAKKINPSRWRLHTEPGARVRIRYRVLADRPGPFGAYADARHVCLNLPQVLMYPVDSRNEQFTLRFDNRPKGWKTAITLTKEDGRYLAENYDELVDTPVHLSNFAQTSFREAGRTVRIVAHPRGGEYNLRLIKQTARKIVAAATELMNDVPFDSYTFVYHFSDAGGGGMEYRNGTSIYAPAQCGDCRMAALTAHEFFHLWNVKRIRPRSLEPIDYARAKITPSLWFAEGVTSAYAQYIMLRAGLTSEADFLARLGQLITRYERRQAKTMQSAEESSIDAWLETYAAYGRKDRSVSYYLQGELIAHLLDLTIRHSTRNQRSLDDVMRGLNREYAQRGRYFEDTDAVERISTQVAGRDLTEEFNQMVRSAAPIPWNHYLRFAGYRLEVTERIWPHTGLVLSDFPGQGVLVSAIEPEGAAEEAGFRRGDQIFRVNRSRVTGGVSQVERKLKTHNGAKVTFAIERDGAPMTLKLRPRLMTEKQFRIVEVEQPERGQLAVRRGWLDRRTDRRPEALFLSQ